MSLLNDPLDIWKRTDGGTKEKASRKISNGYGKLVQLTDIGNILDVIQHWPFNQIKYFLPAVIMGAVPVPVSMALLGRQMRNKLFLIDSRSKRHVVVTTATVGLIGFFAHVYFVLQPLARRKEISLPWFAAGQVSIFSVLGIAYPCCLFPPYFGMHFICSQRHTGTVKSGEYIKFIYRQTNSGLFKGLYTTMGLMLAASILCVYIEKFAFNEMANALEMDDDIFDEVVNKIQRPSIFQRFKGYFR